MGFFPAHDDLKPEMYVTVHSVRRPSAPRHIPQELLEGRPPVEEPTGQFIMPGVPLKIIGVSLPYLVCGMLNPGGDYSGPVILDTRKVRVCRLTSEYVNAIVDFKVEDEEEKSPTMTPEMLEEVMAQQARSSEENGE